MVATSNDYTLYIDTGTYYAKDLITGDTQSNASFAALLSALNTSIGSAGGRLSIRPGMYDLTGTVTLTNPIDVIGSGRGRTTLRRQMTSAFGSTFGVSASNVTVASLTIDGNYDGVSTVGNSFAECVNNTGSNVVFRDLEIKNFQTRGLNNSGPLARFYGCYLSTAVLGANQGGIFTGANTTTIIDSCSIIGVKGGAALTQGNGYFRNCYISGTTIDPAHGGGQIANAANSTTFSVVNCTIEGNYGAGGANDSGIEFGPVTAGNACTFEARGNRISGNSAYGIVTDPTVGAVPLIIENNVVKDCGSGIVMWGSNQKYFSVIGNQCYDEQATPTQKFGILVGTVSGNDATHTSADYYTIKDNLCYGNIYGQWLDMGTGTHKIVKDNIVL